MARLTRQAFLQVITSFPWSNLNKEITGDVLRQFILNTLDSVPEMYLKDGVSIEETIETIKNDLKLLGNQSSSSPDGSIAFSDEFKKVDDVVHLDIGLITASQEESASGDSEAPASEEDYHVFVNDDGLSEAAPTANPETDVAITYDTDEGAYVITFPNDVTVSATDKFKVAKFNLAELGYPELALESGDSLRVEFLIAINETFKTSMVSSPNATFMAFVEPSNSNTGISQHINTMDASPPAYKLVQFNANWYYSLYSKIGVQIVYPRTLLAGSQIMIKNITITRE